MNSSNKDRIIFIIVILHGFSFHFLIKIIILQVSLIIQDWVSVPFTTSALPFSCCYFLHWQSISKIGFLFLLQLGNLLFSLPIPILGSFLLLSSHFLILFSLLFPLLVFLFLWPGKEGKGRKESAEHIIRKVSFITGILGRYRLGWVLGSAGFNG